MKKRVLFAFVAAVMCAALCLTGCGKKNTGGGGDPYVPGSGFLSAQTYGTPDEAINAFIENELNCELVTVARTSEASEEETGDLTEEEKAELKITDEQREGITSAKRYNVKFTETVFVLEDLEDEDQEPVPQITNSEMTIYLLGYADGYRYFTPAPKVGDTLTASYFASLFDYEFYKNCTITMSGTSVTDNVSDKRPGKLMIAEDAFIDYYEYTDYENKRIKCRKYGQKTGNGGFVTIGGSFSEEDDDWKYESEGYDALYADWIKENIIGVVVPEGWSPICLKKTADGFELRKPYVLSYDDDTLEKCSATISGGKVVSGSWKIVMGPDSDTCSYTISDFGTTTITFPAEVQDLIDEEASHYNED